MWLMSIFAEIEKFCANLLWRIEETGVRLGHMAFELPLRHQASYGSSR